MHLRATKQAINMESTKNVKGNRKMLQVTYYAPINYYRIPDNLDLEDKSVVEEYWVKWNTLYIKYVGKKEVEKLGPEYSYADGDAFKRPDTVEIVDADEDYIEYEGESEEDEEYKCDGNCDCTECQRTRHCDCGVCEVVGGSCDEKEIEQHKEEFPDHVYCDCCECCKGCDCCECEEEVVKYDKKCVGCETICNEDVHCMVADGTMTCMPCWTLKKLDKHQNEIINCASCKIDVKRGEAYRRYLPQTETLSSYHCKECANRLFPPY